jgi:hypothetical protein
MVVVKLGILSVDSHRLLGENLLWDTELDEISVVTASFFGHGREVSSTNVPFNEKRPICPSKPPEKSQRGAESGAQISY